MNAFLVAGGVTMASIGILAVVLEARARRRKPTTHALLIRAMLERDHK